jgi:hypothetical protein
VSVNGAFRQRAKALYGALVPLRKAAAKYLGIEGLEPLSLVSQLRGAAAVHNDGGRGRGLVAAQVRVVAHS